MSFLKKIGAGIVDSMAAEQTRTAKMGDELIRKHPQLDGQKNQQKIANARTTAAYLKQISETLEKD